MNNAVSVRVSNRIWKVVVESNKRTTPRNQLNITNIYHNDISHLHFLRGFLFDIANPHKLIVSNLILNVPLIETTFGHIAFAYNIHNHRSSFGKSGVLAAATSLLTQSGSVFGGVSFVASR